MPSDLEKIGLEALLLMDQWSKNVGQYVDDLKKMEDETEKTAKDTAKATEEMSRKQEAALSKVGLAFGAAGAAGLALLGSIAMTASRTEEMGVILDVTATNARRMAEAEGDLAKAAGLTGDAVHAQVAAVKELGITTQVASQLVAQMIRYNLDWSRSTELAALAQDAATFAAQDSSEALQGLIHGITTLNVRVLRTYGIMVSLEQEYQKVADATGRSSASLSAAEKQQIAFNAVLAQAPNIAGAYEAAMDTASKQIRSLSRDTTEVAEAFGQALTPALNSAVGALRDVLHWMRDLPEPVQATAVQVGVLVSSAFSLVGAAAVVIPKLKELKKAVQALAVAQKLASAGLLGPVGLVLGLAAAAFAINAYAKAAEDAHRKEAAGILDASESYKDYLRTLEEAKLGSFALSESLYEVAKSAEAAAEGLDALALTEAMRELGPAKTGITWFDEFIDSFDKLNEMEDPSIRLGKWLERLEKLKPTLTDAEKHILTHEESVRELGKSLGFSGDSLDAFARETLKSTKGIAMQRQALRDAAEMQTVYEWELERLRRGLRDIRMTADEFTDAILRNKLALEGNLDVLEKYNEQSGDAVEGAASRMVDAEDKAAESREKAREDLLEAQEDLEQDHADTVQDLQQEIADSDKELKADLLQAEQDYQKERAELGQEYQQQILDAEQELARDEQQLRQDTLQELADLQRDYEQDRADATLDLNRDLEDMERDHLDKLASLEAGYYADMEALQRAHGDKQKAIAEKYAKEQQSIEEKYRVGPKPETFDDQREKLLALLESLQNKRGISYRQERLDIERELEELKQLELAALEERKDAELAELQAALEAEQGERESAYQTALEAEEQAYQKRQAERERQYNQDLDDLLTARERERAEIQRDQDRKLSELRAALVIEKQEIDRRYQERLASLDTQLQEEKQRLEQAAQEARERLQGQLAEERQNYKERRQELQSHYDDQIQEIDDSLAEEQEKIKLNLADELREIVEGLGDQSRAFRDAYAQNLIDLETYLGDRLVRERQYQRELEDMYLMHSASKWMVDFGKNLTAGLDIGLGPSFAQGLGDALGAFQTSLGSLGGGTMQPAAMPYPMAQPSVSNSQVRHYNLSADFSNSNQFPRIADQFRLMEMASGY